MGAASVLLGLLLLGAGCAAAPIQPPPQPQKVQRPPRPEFAEIRATPVYDAKTGALRYWQVPAAQQAKLERNVEAMLEYVRQLEAAPFWAEQP